jgi:hypothetical protein
VNYKPQTCPEQRRTEPIYTGSNERKVFFKWDYGNKPDGGAEKTNTNKSNVEMT